MGGGLNLIDPRSLRCTVPLRTGWYCVCVEIFRTYTVRVKYIYVKMHGSGNWVSTRGRNNPSELPYWLYPSMTRRARIFSPIIWQRLIETATPCLILSTNNQKSRILYTDGGRLINYSTHSSIWERGFRIAYGPPTQHRRVLCEGLYKGTETSVMFWWIWLLKPHIYRFSFPQFPLWFHEVKKIKLM